MRSRLPASFVAAADGSKILGVRADAAPDHRFTGIWPVVVDGRVFVRSWTQKPDGWYRSLLKDPHATIRIGDRTVRARAVRIRSERLRDAIEDAYSRKYATPGARKYVRGFRTQRRRGTTVEFISGTRVRSRPA